MCPIPDVCIDERRLPLFIARATLRELIAGLEARATGTSSKAARKMSMRGTGSKRAIPTQESISAVDNSNTPQIRSNPKRDSPDYLTGCDN